MNVPEYRASNPLRIPELLSGRLVGEPDGAVTYVSHEPCRSVPTGAEITPAGSSFREHPRRPQSDPYGHDLRGRRSTPYFRRLRAITMRCTWLVPS
jgi:hypothetical protein